MNLVELDNAEWVDLAVNWWGQLIDTENELMMTVSFELATGWGESTDTETRSTR